LPRAEQVCAGKFSRVVCSPDIVTGQPESKRSWLYFLNLASWETVAVFKQGLLGLALWRSALLWVFIADVSEFMLELKVLRASYLSVDLGRYVLQVLGPRSATVIIPARTGRRLGDPSQACAADDAINVRCEGGERPYGTQFENFPRKKLYWLSLTEGTCQSRECVATDTRC
jgi:hypothetical protein